MIREGQPGSFLFGRLSRSETLVSQKRYSPLLDTASNTSFAVDLSRR
jgi:hypothetical protein